MSEIPLNKDACIIRSGEEAVLYDIGDNIARLCFLSKGNSLSPLVRQFLGKVLEADLYGYSGLVIANEGKNFSVGADLTAMKTAIEQGKYGDEHNSNPFQDILKQIKYYKKPIVAAPYKNVLGGGLELCMHCHARVALNKTYMGLVEAGVGLLPAGGGLKESAILIGKAASETKEALLTATFEKLLLRVVSKNAEHAKELHYLQPEDIIIEDQAELVTAAKQICLKLSNDFTPNVSLKNIELSGTEDHRKLMEHGKHLLEENLISPYDLEIGAYIGDVLCGSRTKGAATYTEDQLYILENAGITALRRKKETYDRITHFLKTGQMLRN